jgi:CPA2 family monovalent cation:H+ antiporter-2
MVHLPSLIQDLGVILITAAVTTLVFKRLKQPVVLGYLFAGFLVGPHVPFFPNIVDGKSIHVWAEIGVIFLLFGLGLEFSFKKLAQVGKSAAIAALFEIITMTGAGYALGQVLGWSKMDSLFLGTILSVSSTTIIIRAFQELGFKAKGFVALVFGVLIVEDLAAILIMVLLTIIASPEATSGIQVLFSIGRLGFFLLLWFLVGIYFVPSLLKRVKGLLSDETMLVVSIGLCLLMVIVATQAGFSPALGAFVMGSILAETEQGKAHRHLMVPVRESFWCGILCVSGYDGQSDRDQRQPRCHWADCYCYDCGKASGIRIWSSTLRSKSETINAGRLKPGANRRVFFFDCITWFVAQSNQ